MRTGWVQILVTNTIVVQSRLNILTTSIEVWSKQGLCFNSSASVQQRFSFQKHSDLLPKRLVDGFSSTSDSSSWWTMASSVTSAITPSTFVSACARALPLAWPFPLVAPLSSVGRYRFVFLSLFFIAWWKVQWYNVAATTMKINIVMMDLNIQNN